MIAFVENLAIFVIGVVWAIRRRERAWRDISLALFVLAAATAFESVTGLFQLKLADHHMASTAHRWVAHGLVIVAWFAMIAAVAATVASIRRQPTAAVVAGMVVLLVLALVILESFTGYLGEGIHAGQTVAKETLHRFYVMHCALLPALILAATLGGAMSLRRGSRALNPGTNATNINAPPASDNPYASPGND